MDETYRIGYLSDLVDFRNGKAVIASGGDVRIYGGNGVLGYGNAANYGACVIIGRVGAYCGSTHLERTRCWVSDNALAAVPKDGGCNEYNYYLLKALKLNERQIGSSQPLLTQGILNSIQVNIEFDTQQQQRIAAVLSALDAKIDLNNRINAELEALAKTIYDYWFVQFDFPDALGRPYKSSGGAMVWNDTLKREIPVGWDVAKLSSWVAKTKTGEWGDSELGENSEVQVTCIRGADINALNGSGELNAPTRYISSSKSGKFLAPHDIVIEISGGSPTQSTGRAALISPEVSERFGNPLVCSNFCKALSLGDPGRAHEFLQIWNALYSAGVFFGWEGKTSGIKNLQFDAFVDDHSVPVPPPKLSQKYQGISRSMEMRKQNGLRENTELTQLRDWLLPLLMNGQVRVV